MLTEHFCVLAATESRAKMCYQYNAIKTPSGLPSAHSSLVVFLVLLCGFLLCMRYYVPVYRHGHVEMDISLNHTFSWASLAKWLTITLCPYFGF